MHKYKENIKLESVHIQKLEHYLIASIKDRVRVSRRLSYLEKLCKSRSQLFLRGSEMKREERIRNEV